MFEKLKIRFILHIRSQLEAERFFFILIILHHSRDRDNPIFTRVVKIKFLCSLRLFSNVEIDDETQSFGTNYIVKS